MTEPVEEEVKAPLDPPEEDEVRSARTLDDISSLEDMETLRSPEAPETVTEAVDEAMEADEAEEEVVEEEVAEEPVPEDPDFHTVKINGQEYDLTTDDLIAGYQQAAASQQRFQQASDVEKAAKTVIDNVLTPDKTVDTMIDLYADQMGGDRGKAVELVDEIIGKRVQHLIDLEEMSDEERQVAQITEEKERMAVELQQHQVHQQQQQRVQYEEYQNNQAVPLLDNAITAYNLDVGSPEDKEASQMLAEYIRQGHTITQELANQTVADVVGRRQNLLQSTLSGMTAQDLAAANPDLAAQVQARTVEEIKASRTTQEAASQGSTSKRRRKAKKTTTEYTDSNEFFNDTDF